MPARALMIQGTGSHVGKSLLAAALCRIFTQGGLRVVPFKAQNMSNNACVTADGGEISRAQAEQARACGVEPSVRMNPILLKPMTDVGAQVVVLGKAVGTMTAQVYQAFKPQLLATVTTSLQRLMETADLVVIEGAGSPAEINLKAHDLVNMWVAKQAQAKVLLVGDIDRGGVFAQLVGTMELLDAEERRLIRGFLINKFRGDRALLEPGIRWLEARYGLPVVGVIPYLEQVELGEEDTVPPRRAERLPADDDVQIEVIRVPRMSNFTDFDPLAREPDVRLRYADRPSAEALPDCVILPGSKSTVADLAVLRRQGWDAAIARCVEAGREVVGICGGFQMLGERILDPERVEADVTAAEGLGVLPMTTVFEREKVTTQAMGIHLESGLPVSGYEIHLGRMQAGNGLRPVVRLTQRGGRAVDADDGVASAAGHVWGTYLHGLFDAEPLRRWWLNRLRRRKGLAELPAGQTPSVDGVYDRLAAAVRPHLNLQVIDDILRR